MNDTLVLTVSQLNTYVKSLLDADSNLNNIFLTGEISNCTLHRSGHIYFSLKDSGGVIKAVMFSSRASRLGFLPENGMRVVARGRVSLYERDGAYQFYVDDMRAEGAGSLYIIFEQLKEKLYHEGVFSDEIKQPIPRLPKRIGVITSPTGAALRDILNILSRRYPIGEVVFCPVQVQGSGAAESMIDALKRLNGIRGADVIILGRGGGSIEDLWAFNDENLARAVAASEIPVISAVGHETDYTLCDFASDMRAPTPSAAAELAADDIMSLAGEINYYKNAMLAAVSALAGDCRGELERCKNCLVRNSPAAAVHDGMQRLDMSLSRMNAALNDLLRNRRAALGEAVARLRALSPLDVLSRGYSIAEKGGRAVCSASELREGDDIDLKFSDGSAVCRVTSISR